MSEATLQTAPSNVKHIDGNDIFSLENTAKVFKVTYKATYEQLQRRMGYQRRAASASRALLQAGVDEYEQALDRGKVAEWAKAMRSIVDMVEAEAAIPHPVQETKGAV